MDLAVFFLVDLLHQPLQLLNFSLIFLLFEKQLVKVLLRLGLFMLFKRIALNLEIQMLIQLAENRFQFRVFLQIFLI